MRYLMFLLGLLMFANVASAMKCENLPSCESLGYSKESVKGCAKDGYVLCPWDNDYKKCIDYDCEALGFTESDKTSWCADLIKCQGNPQMTLCQKPCFATNYEELKELAGSGKCKVVTVRNDIEIPQNQGITFAPNTILDGGNHTLTSTGNQGYNLYYFADKTGLKNINIVHTQEDNIVNFYFSTSSTSSNQISFENVNINLTSSDSKNGSRYMFYKGTYNITGKFDLEDQSAQQVSVFTYDATRNFKDADVHILTTHGGSDIFPLGALTMENTTFDIQSGGVSFLNSGTAQFKNTQGEFRSNGLGVIYSIGNLPHVILQEGCDIKLRMLSQNGLVNRVDLPQKIELSGTAEKPTKLTIIDASETFRNLSVEAHDLNVTLVINGVTYKPKKATITLLSAIGTSPDWQQQ